VISVGALTPILVCFHKLEITPLSNFNHPRDGTIGDKPMIKSFVVAAALTIGLTGAAIAQGTAMSR
jgi:hypothetical protein